MARKKISVLKARIGRFEISIDTWNWGTSQHGVLIIKNHDEKIKNFVASTKSYEPIWVSTKEDGKISSFFNPQTISIINLSQHKNTSAKIVEF